MDKCSEIFKHHLVNYFIGGDMRLKRTAFLTTIFILISAFPYYTSQLHPDSDYIVIEDFNKSGNSFFREWKNRDTTESPWKEYYLLNENGKKFLRGSTKSNTALSIQIGKIVNDSWNIFSYPVLSWEWRVHKTPAYARENSSKRNDSAAGIYVLFQRKKVPLVSWKYQPLNWIKYVWSSSLPVGTVVPRKKVRSGVTLYEGRYVVVASGKKDLGKWLSFRRNVLADYKKYFGTNPLGNPLMVAILTDSNSTRSTAIADYSSILAWKD
ncbi:MAG TPA: DUF3047 domain-containing protein [Spirochaetota bacterium]|nr:DUF3047 domain-containing protein [Spirochaetota bacterium]HPJ35066.1 DUF3047 domain-containing protein [Spirochaetota bacterium]